MVEFTFTEPEEEYECPNPGEKSTIIFEVEYVDGDDWGIYEMAHEGGAAAYESEFGAGLEYTIQDMFSVKEDGLIEGEFYVIEGFVTSYRTDYYGEVDCDHYIDNFRKASIYDRLYFGV